jgi:hypothetical protein
LPRINANNWTVAKLFVNKNVIKLDDINSLSNVYVDSLTSNIVRYNYSDDLSVPYLYTGRFAIHRENVFTINSSNIVINTTSNNDYVVSFSSNVINTGIYAGNTLQISTSNEIVDDGAGASATELIHFGSNIIKDEFAIYRASLSNAIIIDEYYKRPILNNNLDNTINIQLTTFNKTKLKPHIILGNSVKGEESSRKNIINEIYSYDGNLRFNYSDNIYEHPQLLIDKLGNVRFYGNVLTSNDLFISGRIFNVNGQNIIETLDGKIESLEATTSNLLLTNSEALNATIILNDLNASNYIMTSSNMLIFKANENDRNASNYVLATSNTLIAKANFNDRNSSNYVLATSNTLIAKANFNDLNASNYVLATSNTLISKANFNDRNSSNYVLATSNTLITKANFNDLNASNYVLATSNTLITKANFNDRNASNYVVATSNLISTRISNLTTDMIRENAGAVNRFIVNNAYSSHLNVDGNLTVASNLIVLGASTTLETEVYTTERLEINNANNNSMALVIQQRDIINDIIRASNRDSNVFTIGNNGDVRITGTYIKNNRDVLIDTSNYVVATSNIITRRLVDTASNIGVTMRINDTNNSNYVLSTSAQLTFAINNTKTAWVMNTSNVYTMSSVSIGTTSNIDTLTVDGAIICSRGITTSFSDNRLKDYTSNIANPIDLINKLNGFHFVPNELAHNYGFSRVPDIGLSAQEVQSILPDIVKIAPFDMLRDEHNNIVSRSGDNYLTVCYEKMAPLFVESIKALKKELDELRAEVAELRKGRDII